MLKNLKEFKLAEVEAEVLKFWKQNSIFEQALKKNQGKSKYVFFEGPPTANGMPGIHHQLARSFKDVMPRFKSMQGFDVPRKGGWDTHGLPVEIQAEKELGFNGKQDIEKYGIAEFNAKCKELVWRYRAEFESATDRLGFWLDLKNPYVTYENNYIESLWNIIAQIDKRKLLYQGNKIVPWCTRCGTALSSHELAQGYKEVEDTSVYVKFKLTAVSAKKVASHVASGEAMRDNLKQMSTFVLSWTTTPWTLPGNVALAVGEKIEYSVIEVADEILILASTRLASVFPDATHYKLLTTQFGKDLVGLEYEPLFAVKPLKSKKSYKVYAADFVTTTDGTGVVHTAVMYGEDDYRLGIALGLPQHHTVTEQGHFTKDVQGLAGLYAKSGRAEVAIIEQLTKNGNLLRTEKYKHEYPHCWRCSTPLLYYGRSSWFVAMSKLRKELMAANEGINWTPAHIKQGRFGEWLKEVKDWNFSRERYWGTPLPVWQSKDGKTQLVVSSLADIKKYAASNGNTFFGMRHGEATHNVAGKLAGGSEKGILRSELTPKGIKQVEDAAKKLKKEKISVIVASPYYRAQQTAKILAKALKVKVVTDKRLGEVDAGILNWQSVEAYWKFYRDGANWLTGAPEKGESHAAVLKRVMECVISLDTKFKKKNVLLISHGDPLRYLHGGINGFSDTELATMSFEPRKAEVVRLGSPVLPYNDEGRLDVHRPYIDRIVLRDPKTKKELYRVKEVCDVWFDSGAMPFAQSHYPFDTSKGKPQKIDFPADYICEGIDQTRGWFYTLLAIATLLKREAPYKNVICTGLIHDKNGLKMSKSKGNIVDPMQIMNTFGADALRWYFFTINDPGDPKNFDEADLTKITRRFLMILYNSFIFWNSYGQGIHSGAVKNPTNVLDRWIAARLNQLISEVTASLERYEIGKAALMIEQFTDDLSRWYIRRSRDRFQSSARGDSSYEADFREASATLQYALAALSKLIAPCMPFFGEALYQSLDASQKSVHLENWPVADTKALNPQLLKDMVTVRELAAVGLALRADAKIKVRQPLASLTVKDTSLKGKDELIKILLDEVNVKEVLFDAKLTVETGAVLDTVLTAELREEGIVRELTRAVSGLRADAGYQMGDEILLMIASDDAFSDLVQRQSLHIKKAVNAKLIELKKSDKVDAQLDTKVGEVPVWIGVRKV
jgi:isoleucyl-tRNA synthetase